MKYLLATIMYTSVVIFSSNSLYGQDNKFVNKIVKQELPCDKKPVFGSYWLYDTEKKVEVYGQKGFPIYTFLLGMQPKTISMLTINSVFEVIDATHITFGGGKVELNFEGNKVTMKLKNGIKNTFYECTESDLEVDKIIEIIRENKKNIKFAQYHPNIKF